MADEEWIKRRAEDEARMAESRRWQAEQEADAARNRARQQEAWDYADRARARRDADEGKPTSFSLLQSQAYLDEKRKADASNDFWGRNKPKDNSSVSDKTSSYSNVGANDSKTSNVKNSGCGTTIGLLMLALVGAAGYQAVHLPQAKQPSKEDKLALQAQRYIDDVVVPSKLYEQYQKMFGEVERAKSAYLQHNLKEIDILALEKQKGEYYKYTITYTGAIDGIYGPKTKEAARIICFVRFHTVGGDDCNVIDLNTAVTESDKLLNDLSFDRKLNRPLGKSKTSTPPYYEVTIVSDQPK